MNEWKLLSLVGNGVSGWKADVVESGVGDNDRGGSGNEKPNEEGKFHFCDCGCLKRELEIRTSVKSGWAI